MKKLYAINGGAGRVLSSIPAFERLAEREDNFGILCEGGLDMFLGHPTLQDKAIAADQKNIFPEVIKHACLITPEPYRHHPYYNQRMNLSQAFFDIIVGEEPPSILKPAVYLNKEEEYVGAKVIADCMKTFGKPRTIVIQPFGASCQEREPGVLIDGSTRSFEAKFYKKLVDALSSKYNLIYMGTLDAKEDTRKILRPQASLRLWASIIAEADYFIGCDSLGQHMAYAMGTPGTVILGSTFVQNVVLDPSYFNVVDKKVEEKVYQPIRISGLGSMEADRLNDRLMDFSKKETGEIIKSIISHIKKVYKGN